MKFVAKQTASTADRTVDSSQPSVVAGMHNSYNVAKNVEFRPITRANAAVMHS